MKKDQKTIGIIAILLVILAIGLFYLLRPKGLSGGSIQGPNQNLEGSAGL